MAAARHDRPAAQVERLLDPPPRRPVDLAGKRATAVGTSTRSVGITGTPALKVS
ncbi:MAG: hypothetical protein KY464_18405 [Gemmatimonadetes bacterium]|nr:hypothetical protein [Gemmatimonadota bacterium]